MSPELSPTDDVAQDMTTSNIMTNYNSSVVDNAKVLLLGTWLRKGLIN